MEKENKVVYVNFSDGRYEKPVHGIEQWDIKPYLAITGLDLEEGVQVHFSLTEYEGDAKRVLGENQNGILVVEIPAFILEGENECCYPYDGEYHAYAWVYIAREDSAETVKKMELRIRKRPKPADYEEVSNPDIIEQLRRSLVRTVEDKLVEAEANGDFDGPSAYEIAVANGFKGTELEWLESLKIDGSDNSELPVVDKKDDGKVLMVVDGEWTAKEHTHKADSIDGLQDVINAVADSKFYVVTFDIDSDGQYHGDLTFAQIHEKYEAGGNMVARIDGTDYIPLLSVASHQIIFSGIYQDTSISLTVNSNDVCTLTSTPLARNSHNHTTATQTSNGFMSKDDKIKLGGIEANAEVNVIESISVNGEELLVTDKEVNIVIPEPEVPTFDLAEMGLPLIPVDGTHATLEIDTTDLRQALDKGSVKLKAYVDYGGYPLPVDFIGVSLYNVATNTYSVSGIIPDANAMLCTCVIVEVSGIYAFVVTLRTDTDSDVDNEEEPEENIPTDYIYSLPQETTFNGTSDYIDTGIKLFDTAKDFTLFFSADTTENNASGSSLFHCVREIGPYPGLSSTVDWYDTNSYVIGGNWNDDAGKYVTNLQKSSNVKGCIVCRNGIVTKILYDVAEDTVSSPTNLDVLNNEYLSHNMTLLLGSYQTSDGTKGRFWKGIIYDFKVYDRVLSDSEINSLFNS